MPSIARTTSKSSRFMAIAWFLIALKCVFVAWAASLWELPFGAGWVIWPTVAFGLLATGLWRSREFR